MSDPKSFQQWKLDNADLLAELEQSPTVDCSECDGDGYHECDCGDLHQCRTCGGTGKQGRNIDRALELYQTYLAQDKKRLEAWDVRPITGE